jgi:hypothetical protein
MAVADEVVVNTTITRCEQALKDLGEKADMKKYQKYWTNELHKHVDGKDLKETQNHKSSNCWNGGDGLALSGREFVNFQKLKTNSLPSRARCARGRPNLDISCRAGCQSTETPYHTIQTCFRTHSQRIERHDKIADVLWKHFRSKNLEVEKEHRYQTSVGIRKPDLVIKHKGQVNVLDIQVSKGSDVQGAHRYKQKKYEEIEGFEDVLKRTHGVEKVVFDTCSISYKGVWAKGSILSLTRLHVPNDILKRIVGMAIRGSYQGWMVFNQSTSVRQRLSSTV